MSASKLVLEYHGGDFSGWARQDGKRTVQGEVERALGVVLRAGGDVPVVVAGRTDAGVHAWGQVASYVGGPASVRSLNGVLPDDMSVLSCEDAPEGFDARRDAVSRMYCYRVLNRSAPSPFHARTAVWHPGGLDREALAACAALLPGRHDFTAFTPTETEHMLFERDVLSARWDDHREVLEFWIEAQTFMRHMNRVLVGTMLEVGTGSRSLESFGALLEGAPRSAAGRTAPAHGLALASVRY